MNKIKLLVFIGICISFFTSVAQESTQNAIDVSKNIQYSEFSKHLEYLSSDELKGRDTGSEGYAQAADYVGNELKELGMLPFGDDNTYFQKIPLNKRYLIKSSLKVEAQLNGEKVEGIYGENISLVFNPSYDEVNTEQELVFVGYGNVFPEDNINDYKDVDVKGKTVIVVLGAPKGMDNKLAIDPFLKITNAVKNGASGIILFLPNSKLIQGFVFKQLHGYLSAPMITLDDTSTAKSVFDFNMQIAGLTKKELIKDIFKLNGLNLKKELKKIKKGNSASISLASKIHCSYNIKQEKISCKNVVALLPGSDPTLKNEYLVMGAHLDHLGIGAEVKGDSIYNGMWDNASGSAAIISMAKAYTELENKPNRSVVFVCYTGEEKGLLGSNYYANNNNIEDGKIIANLNIDMLGNLFETKDIIPMGYSHSNLSEAVDFAANTLNLQIDDNKQEEIEYLERSDQISFIKNEIPALNIGSGYTALDPKINATKETTKWMKKTYHSPFDDLNQDYSPESFLTYIQVNFLTSYYITHKMGEIKWNEESWVYQKYVYKEPENKEVTETK
ncbi:M28 family peptidase [Candidatus Woesearchaeota archaeon]|nr:M28 family peptidase [Candidatus Woesearchaeota archaeon]